MVLCHTERMERMKDLGFLILMLPTLVPPSPRKTSGQWKERVNLRWKGFTGMV